MQKRYVQLTVKALIRVPEDEAVNPWNSPTVKRTMEAFHNSLTDELDVVTLHDVKRTKPQLNPVK